MTKFLIIVFAAVVMQIVIVTVGMSEVSNSHDRSNNK
jgi:hypothetical protein